MYINISRFISSEDTPIYNLYIITYSLGWARSNMHGRYICFKTTSHNGFAKEHKKEIPPRCALSGKHKIQHKMHLTKKLVSLYISFIHVLFYKLFFSQAYILHLLFLVSTQK